MSERSTWDGRLSKRMLLAVFAGWGALTAFCASGFPPPVDLPADGAQVETLVNLLRGDAAVSAFYEIHFPIGYGLPFWLVLPLAWIWNGAVAIRSALWVALFLFPVAHLALLRTFQRPDWVVILGLPFAFNISYWYGLVPGLFAQPLALLSVAAFMRALQDPRPRWIVSLNILALATLLSHLVAFVALGVMLGAAAVCRPRTPAGDDIGSVGRAIRIAVLGLAIPLALSAPKVWSMAGRAVTPGPWPATQYEALSHLTWLFQNYRPEGRLAVWGPLAVSVIFAAAYVYRHRREPRGPAGIFLATLLLYLAAPKTLSGIYLISVRLVVFVGLLSLLLVNGSTVPKALRWTMIGLSLISLGETGVFHWRFARAIEGLDSMLTGPAPGRHGYWSLAGPRILGSRHIYLQHLGQWLTATRGGVGHNFFADAEHHPVRYRDGVNIPTELEKATPEQLLWFDQILLFGDGPLPTSIRAWREVARAGQWRKLVRP